MNNLSHKLETPDRSPVRYQDGQVKTWGIGTISEARIEEARGGRDSAPETKREASPRDGGIVRPARKLAEVSRNDSSHQILMSTYEDWNMRGNRGDMIEGDWIAEGAIECVNEPHHSFLSGVTAFSAN